MVQSCQSKHRTKRSKEVVMKSTAQKLILISFVLALIAAVTVFLYLTVFKITK